LVAVIQFLIPAQLVLAQAQAPAPAAVPPKAPAQPSPQLSPEDVIRLQIRALSAKGALKSRIDNCYRFASPANRDHTGPIVRFQQMIESPKYRALLDARHFLVGRATQNGREAHLLLTVVDRAGQLALFRCFLSKQTAAPYADCWMTDAVVRIGEAAPGGPAPPARPSPTI
jgi:hypothetical protein